MADIKERQSSDSAQGGEGTNSLNGRSYDALTKNIGTPPGNTEAPEPEDRVGTK